MKNAYTADIYYVRPEFGRDFRFGDFSAFDHNDLLKTHKFLTSRNVLTNDTEALEELYEGFQAENWSPNGEARGLIQMLGLEHTSMSIGDLIVLDTNMYIVDSVGFKKVS